MPNIRGNQILALLSAVKKLQPVSINDLVLYLSINPPYIKKVTILKYIDDLTQGKYPKIKIDKEDNVSICIS